MTENIAKGTITNLGCIIHPLHLNFYFRNPYIPTGYRNVRNALGVFFVSYPPFSVEVTRGKYPLKILRGVSA